MRIAVIGAGVVGVTTAFELGADGHAVTVFERHATVGAEASFGHAGLMAPGNVAPWAAPGMPRKVISRLFGSHPPLRLRGAVDASTLAWLWRWWRACRPLPHRLNRARMVRLAQFSRDRLDALTNRLHLEFESAQGCLIVLRSPRELAIAQPGLQALAQLGVAVEVVDGDACRRIEPGLNPATPLHAGIHCKDDRVGNCRQFAHLLRREAERAGVRFVFDTTVERIDPGPQPELVVRRSPSGFEDRDSARGTRGHDRTDIAPREGDDGHRSFDAVVVCNALGALPLLRPLGVRLPLLAVHGCSLTAPLRRDDVHMHLEPRAGVVDARHEVAISRLGNRVRVAGGAEIGGDAERSHPATAAMLDKVLDDWFPGVVNYAQAQRWKGARPMLPDGPPVLGPSGREGVWLNVGHGDSGWALACGSARLVADAIVGRPTPIGIDGLGIARLRGGSLRAAA